MRKNITTKLLISSLATVASLSVFSTAQVHAATIDVTTTADDFTTNGNCSLREAIKAANTDTAVDACAAGSGSDVITLASASTYILTRPGSDEDANATGDLDINSTITINGNGSTVQASNAINDRVLHVLSGATLNLNNATLTGGRAVSSTQDGIIDIGGVPYEIGGGGLRLERAAKAVLTTVTLTGNRGQNGGAIYNFGELAILSSNIANNQGFRGGGVKNNGSVRISKSTISGNNAINNAPDWAQFGAYGGGISNDFRSAQMQIDNSSIVSNTVTGLFGGGIYNGDFNLLLGVSSLVVKSSVIGYNTGSLAGGGVMNDHGSVRLLDTLIISNTAGEGGGLYSSSGDLVLSKAEINSNVASSGDGGGLFNASTSKATDTIFRGNTSVRNGGNILNSDGKAVYWTGAGSFQPITATFIGTLEIDRSELSLGSAANGAGLYNSAVVTAANTSIADNKIGGGVRNNSGPYAANLVNVTVFSNTGGGLLNTAGALRALNVLAADSCSGSITSRGNNLDTANTCGFTQAGDQINVSDPKIGLLADNGSQKLGLRSIALLAGSPAIDAGSNTGCPTSDARGFTRPQNAKCDIGAYEFSIGNSSLAGAVFFDVNNDGVKQADEPGISGVRVTLSGGQQDSRDTGADGEYRFDGLPAGIYALDEVQPSDRINGATTAGSFGGTVNLNTISAINVPSGSAGTGYFFGEGKQIQTISLTLPISLTAGTAPYLISAISTSGSAVTLTASPIGVCSMSGYSVRPLSIGICAIRATAPGNSEYTDAVFNNSIAIYSPSGQAPRLSTYLPLVRR